MCQIDVYILCKELENKLFYVIMDHSKLKCDFDAFV